jgi:hypothetical protein
MTIVSREEVREALKPAQLPAARVAIKNVYHNPGLQSHTMAGTFPTTEG